MEDKRDSRKNSGEMVFPKCTQFFSNSYKGNVTDKNDNIWIMPIVSLSITSVNHLVMSDSLQPHGL